MPQRSAGILIYRRTGLQPEILLLHLGGPLWSNKDKWHFPKGQLEVGEDDRAAARREFREETGAELPAGDLLDLGEAKQGPKLNRIWALEADIDLNDFPKTLHTNLFEMEWPPHSGHKQRFPENDRIGWFGFDAARQKVFVGLVVFIDRLAEQLDLALDGPPEQQSLL